jgi:hypothetical protein
MHPVSLPSSFSISSRSFASLSLISPHPLHIWSIVSLSSRHILYPLASSSVQYLFSPSSFLHLNLAIIFLSLALSLFRYTETSSVMHLSYSLLYLDSLILSLLSCLSVSLSLSSALIHLPSALILSTSPLAYPFLLQYFSLSLSSLFFSFFCNTQTVSCTLPFRPFCPRTLPLSFPLSISACSSCTLPSLCTPVFLCPLLAPISNIFHAVSPPPLVPSIPRSLSRTSALTSPLSLSYSPNTSNYLVRLFHHPSQCALSVALSLKV